MKLVSVLALFCGVLLSSCVYRELPRRPGLIEQGREFARNRCAHCHGIGRLDESPLEQAPPFRRLHQRYPVEQLAEAFAEGIVVGHSEMPPFELQPHEIAALLAYLESLESRGGTRD